MRDYVRRKYISWVNETWGQGIKTIKINFSLFYKNLEVAEKFSYPCIKHGNKSNQFQNPFKK